MLRATEDSSVQDELEAGPGTRVQVLPFQCKIRINGSSPARRDPGWPGFGHVALRRRFKSSQAHSVEIELVALGVLHHDARLVLVIGRQ
jgi:hypothetical protein